MTATARTSPSVEPQATPAATPDSVRLTPEARRDFCVVVPAYNEAENVPELVAELRATFERFGLEGEVVLVDDGSSDATAELAERHAAAWPALRVVRHRTNFGKTEALLTAARHTGRRWLILFDADLQHAPDEIPRYLEKLGEGWDIVTGRKVGRYEKGAVSRAYNWLSRRLFDVPVSDLNSMKGFDRAVLDEVRLRHDWHRFFVVLAYARGFTVTELPITLYPRRHGEAKYSAKSRIVVGVLDLVSVAFFLRFSRKPLLLFGASGMAMAALGVVVGLTTLALRLAHIETPFGYRPFLYLVILLETLGFLLFGFGMIAELIAQQHTEIDALHRRIEGGTNRE
ncbi:MAG TPA: glycosyltransferase family 2 protein [Longimicrobiales bacterium]|nr:glycosyltransferase family 2 protein [Longimicrobiales bacterium]